MQCTVNRKSLRSKTVSFPVRSRKDKHAVDTVVSVVSEYRGIGTIRVLYSGFDIDVNVLRNKS